MIKNQNQTEGMSFLDDHKKNESTQNNTKKISINLTQSLSENNSFNKHYRHNRSFSITSAISVSNLSIKRRESLFKSYPELEHEFGNMDKIDLKMLLANIIRNLLFIDVFCGFTNIAVVTWLYFDHFDYINNNYVVSELSNIYRVVCIILSVLVCIALIFRSSQNSKMKNVKFLLSMRNSGKKKNTIFIKFNLLKNKNFSRKEKIKLQEIIL
jgi:hypothetical protein